MDHQMKPTDKDVPRITIMNPKLSKTPALVPVTGQAAVSYRRASPGSFLKISTVATGQLGLFIPTRHLSFLGSPDTDCVASWSGHAANHADVAECRVENTGTGGCPMWAAPARIDPNPKSSLYLGCKACFQSQLGFVEDDGTRHTA